MKIKFNKRIIVLLIIILLLVIILFHACGSKKAKESQSVVGSWTYPNSLMTYIFSGDGRGSYYDMDFTYKTSGDKISILYDGNTSPYESTYRVENNQFIILDTEGNEIAYKKDK